MKQQVLAFKHSKHNTSQWRQEILFNNGYIYVKVRNRAKIRNRYNQAAHLTQDTNEKVIASQFYFGILRLTLINRPEVIPHS